MKTLSGIKKDMEFNTGLSSLLEVLKAIAVSQYKSLERNLKTYEKFTPAVESIVESIDIDRAGHIFVKPKQKTQIVVAVTSDSGLLGGLNMQVINTAVKELEKMQGKLVVVGQKGKNYAAEIGIPFTAFGGIVDDQRYLQAMQLRDYILDNMLKDSIGYLKVVYPHPVSFTVQRSAMVSFLPFDNVKKAKYKDDNQVILESKLDDIIEYIVYLWVGQKLYDIFGLSRLAEFAARFIHLEGSAQKLKDMDSKLRLQYFRIRHELIDCNMRELFSARILYAGKHS